MELPLRFLDTDSFQVLVAAAVIKEGASRPVGALSLFSSESFLSTFQLIGYSSRIVSS